MDKNLHDIDKLFHDALEPLKDQPGKQVWDRIGSELDKDETARLKKRYLWFKRSSLVLLLLLLSFGVYHLVTVNNMRMDKGHANTAAVENTNTNAGKPAGAGISKDNSAEKLPPIDNSALPGNETGKNSSNNIPGNDNRLQQSIDPSATTAGSENKPAKSAVTAMLSTVTKQDPAPANTVNRIADKNTAVTTTNKDAAGKEKLLQKNMQRMNRSGKLKTTVTGSVPVEDDNGQARVITDKPEAFTGIARLTQAEFEKIPVSNSKDNVQPGIIQKQINSLAVNEKPVNEKNKAGVKKTTGKTASRWLDLFSVGAFYATGFSENKLEDDHNHADRNGRDDRQQIKNRESSAVNTSVGVTLNVKLNRHLSVQTGAGYASTKYNTGETKVYAVKDNDGNIRYRNNSSYGYCYFLPEISTSPVVGDSLRSTGGYSKLKYVEIPLQVNYAIGKKKIVFNPGVGVSLDILSGAVYSATVQASSSKTTAVSTPMEGLKKTSVSLLVTPQVQYKLSNRMSVNLSPYLKYAVKPINTGNVVNTYPLNMGAGLGMIYKF